MYTLPLAVFPFDQLGDLIQQWCWLAYDFLVQTLFPYWVNHVVKPLLGYMLGSISGLATKLGLDDVFGLVDVTAPMFLKILSLTYWCVDAFCHAPVFIAVLGFLLSTYFVVVLIRVIFWVITRLPGILMVLAAFAA